MRTERELSYLDRPTGAMDQDLDSIIAQLLAADELLAQGQKARAAELLRSVAQVGLDRW